MTEEEAEALLYDWRFWARPSQLPPEPDDWRIWLLMAGRGFGKTWVGANWIIEKVRQMGRVRVALVGRASADVRDIMVEGETGILALSPPDFTPHYAPTMRRLTWPNGAVATTFGAMEPDLLRGPQHHIAWADELAAWQYPEALDQLLFGLRLGDNPQLVATTTPKPVEHLKRVRGDAHTVTVSGTTYENMDNLPEPFLRDILARYEGTRLGRQELMAELLEDVPGALWKITDMENYRASQTGQLSGVVVGVDPPASSAGNCGIIVIGYESTGLGYVLEDATMSGTPEQWGAQVVAVSGKYGANAIVAEVNQGGDMVAHVIWSSPGGEFAPVKTVRASRSKQARAEPIQVLYQRGMIKHVGTFGDLEAEMTQWVPNEGLPSPDRLDAMVWAFTHVYYPQEDAAPEVVVVEERRRISPF